MKWLARIFRRGPSPADNYSPRAQKLLVLTRRQADRLRHSYVGTEHLLLGLLEMQEGVGFTALQRLGLNLESMRQELESRSGVGKETTVAPMLPMTPAVKKVLMLGCDEARKMGHAYVGTEHVLLGLIRVRPGIAPAVLRKFEADLEKARRVVTEILPQPPDQKNLPPPAPAQEPPKR